jgi:hypothetical protein
MNVKEAVSAAKTSIAELFGDELVSDPLLEEVEFDNDANIWRITIGFLRVPEMPREAAVRVPGFGAMLGTPRRVYKVVNINDGNKRVVSVKDRELPQ